MESDARPYEILEHTADIGLRAWGETLERLFEVCAAGVADLLGRLAGSPVPNQPDQTEALNAVPIEVEADDVEALLVEWMNELIFAIETKDGCVGEVRVLEVKDTSLRGMLTLAPCGGTLEGTELKAATYHQVSVRQVSGQWEATVYFDV